LRHDYDPIDFESPPGTVGRTPWSAAGPPASLSPRGTRLRHDPTRPGGSAADQGVRPTSLPVNRSKRSLWCLFPALVLLYFLYLFRITGTGLLSTDEPRYASVSREMARSGDWVTPRLWGQPWFEKPALLYWMTGAGFRLGLGEELAPRLPVALLSLLFLAFFYWFMRREFGATPAGYAAAILGSCAGWVSFSYSAVPDLPMSAFFSAAMLLGMIWLRDGQLKWLTAAAGALGFAVLAKGLVPLALAIPFAWEARSKWRGLLRWQPVAAFFAVAAPWYVLCYIKNGAPFVQTFFWEHHFGRYTSTALQHVQPFWYYIPVAAAALFPWTPAATLLFSRRLYLDPRCRFLLLWLIFGLIFFSVGPNKLPGYILPLVPPAAALAGIALAEAGRSARWVLAGVACLLCLVFPLASVLPQALAAGLSRSSIPAWNFLWTLPIGLAAAVWYLEFRRLRSAAVFLLAAALTAAVIYLKLISFPEIDSISSARPLWRTIVSSPGAVCVEAIPRNWRYGLNYYSIEPLPDCDQSPRPVHVAPGDGVPRVLGYVMK
jgi:4-amino-4-deoxy-L-arabinose transferase-like glycosyltransferase